MTIITLRDVARRSGVSHVTVSRVLSGNTHVLPSTRQTVLKAVRALKYKPNVVAQTLALRRTGNPRILIQVLVCHSQLPAKNEAPGAFQMQVLQGISDAVHADGHADFSLSYWRSGGDEEAQLLRLQRANGVLLMGYSDRDLVIRLRKRGIKLVLADHAHAAIDVDAVVSDNVAAGRTAARYLLERGHQHIGWLGGPRFLYAYQQRCEGVRQELAAAGIRIVARDYRSSPQDEVSEYERVVTDWIHSGRFPSAIVLGNSLATLGVLHVLHGQALRCPDDVSLISLDLDAYNAACRPRPTALATAPQNIGQKAMERLLQIVRTDADWKPRTTVLPMRLIEGESVAPARCDQVRILNKSVVNSRRKVKSAVSAAK